MCDLTNFYVQPAIYIPCNSDFYMKSPFTYPIPQCRNVVRGPDRITVALGPVSCVAGWERILLVLMYESVSLGFFFGDFDCLGAQDEDAPVRVQ